MQLGPDDEALPVQEARAGEPAAWSVLLRRFRLPLYAYVFELVHDEQTSLDIVQETFINAARHIGGLRQDDKFGSWLFNIAHQKCAQHWRRQQRADISLDVQEQDFPDAGAGPEELLIRKEQEEEFMSVLGQLAVPHRAVLLLHFVEDFSLEEIARITGTQIGTVKSRLHYARKALKKLWENQNEDTTPSHPGPSPVRRG
jgi:RNA polymerase sigma-70 factor, ECF subfamily